jgi:hypothetical protein
MPDDFSTAVQRRLFYEILDLTPKAVESLPARSVNVTNKFNKWQRLFPIGPSLNCRPPRGRLDCRIGVTLRAADASG